jgi:hypothetical protein
MSDIAKLSRMSAAEAGAELTPLQRRVVDILVAEGGTIGDAGVKAGYAPNNPEAARVSASNALRLPHVQMYMFKRVAEDIGIHGFVGLNVLRTLAQSAKSEFVRLEASKDLLDRGGFKAPERQQQSGSLDVKINIDLTQGDTSD